MSPLRNIIFMATAAVALVARDSNVPHRAEAVTTAAPSFTRPPHCDNTYCDGTSSWCFYWAGVTGYDISRGPVPGETRVNIGGCKAPSTAAMGVAERKVDSPLTSAPVPTVISDCDYSYCDGSTSWCFYWAGVTAYDVSRGPIPGESRIEFGSCAPTATASSSAGL